MSNTKKILGLAIAIFVALPTLFANNERGIDLYRAELYDAAKFFFLEKTKQGGSEQAESYYYLGQIYNEQQQADSALYYYAKSKEIDANYPFGYIGEGSLDLKKGNIKEAEELFKKAESLAKKNASVMIAVADAYIEVKQYSEAEKAIAKAKKINKNYVGIFMAEGDLYRSQENVGQAAKSYDTAISTNAKEKLAYLKSAELYKQVNPDVAFEYLDRLIAVDSEYIPAYALMGDINRGKGRYQQALKAYEKFISISGVPLLQHQRYAELLYFTDQFDKSLQEINYVLSKEPDNVVMHRLQAYNNFKLENYELGTQQMDAFMQSVPKDQLIYLDYFTYGQLLMKVKRTEDALVAFQNAIALDNTKIEIYKEMAGVYLSLANYPQMIEQYEKYFEAEPNATLVDWLMYANGTYAFAAKFVSADYKATPISPEQKTTDDALFYSLIEKANKAYDRIIELRPTAYQAYRGKARSNALVDLKEQEETGTSVMKGVAKPHYEKAIEVMLASNENGERNRDILEGYRYLASYYLLLDDKENAGVYFKKILEIDPDNAEAKNALEVLGIK